MTQNLPVPQLDLTPAEAEGRFDELQRKLVPLWKSIQSFNQDEQTIVVVPSLTIDFECSSSELQAYEERFLFLLLLLRQPRARVSRTRVSTATTAAPVTTSATKRSPSATNPQAASSPWKPRL